MSATTNGVWLTTAEVAERLRLSKQTVSNLAKDGAFHGAVLIGGRGGWRIPESSVSRYMEARGDQ